MSSTVLITGVAGLIGSNFADWLLENINGIKVVGIDDLSGGYLDNVNKECIFFKEDLVDDNLSYIFKKFDIENIYHFAAYAAEGLSPFMRQYNHRNNLVATARLINHAIEHRVKRFVFTSSMATYGSGTAPFSEEDRLQPIDPYGIAKMACELDLHVAKQQHDLDYCIIRPHNVYGEKQNIWDRYRNVLGIWMHQHLSGNPLTIFGDGKQQRAFSYIGDCMEPLWNAGHQAIASGEIINLGGTQHISIEGAADILIDVMGGGIKEYRPARHEVRDAWSTWEKSQRLLGYKDSHTLRSGLTKMWHWAKDQPVREQRVWESYELEKGLYDYWR